METINFDCRECGRLFETREHRDDHIETHRKGVGKKAYNKQKMEETKLKNRAEAKENKIETP